MKVLVTGASGGMGGDVIRTLLKRNVEVIATSRSDESLKRQELLDKVTYIPYDLNSKSDENLFEKFGRPDVVIHLAWDKLREHKSEDHFTSILQTHEAFLENLVRNGLRDVNVVGTCYEYGLREGELDEEMKPEPVIAYAIGKNLLREYLTGLTEKYNATFKWMRVFNVFGPGKEGANLYSLLMSAVKRGDKVFNMSGGEQVRDYLSPAEVAELIVMVSMQNKVTGIINTCSGKPTKLKDLITSFLTANHLTIELNLGYYPYLAHEPMVHWGSTRKLKRVLDQAH